MQALRAARALGDDKRLLLLGKGMLPVLLAIAASLRLGSKKLTEVELLYGGSGTNSEEGQPQQQKRGEEGTYKRAVDLCRLLLSVASREELLYALATTATLLVKSFLNVRLVTLLTDVERNLMRRDAPAFYSSIATYVSHMLPQALANALLHYNVYLLSLKLREKLTLRLFGKYFADNCYYHLLNRSSRAGSTAAPPHNVDQLLTSDIGEFAGSVVSAFLYTVMPSIDIAVHMKQLLALYGPAGPISLGAYYGAAYLLMLLLRLPGSAFAHGEQELEAEYRRTVAHATGNAEEIASLRGGDKEKANILSAFDRLVSYVSRFYRYRFALGFVDNNIARHFLTVLSWAVVAREQLAGGGDSDRYMQLHTYLRLLKSVSGSIGGLIISSRSVMKILGIGKRIVALDHTLDAVLRQGRVADAAVARAELVRDDVSAELLCEVNNATVASPSGVLLIKNLSFEVLRGQSIFISGPSGCGKSTLLRCMMGLAGLASGSITVMRSACTALYLPQKPFFTLGTLRDQIIYPRVYDSSGRCAIGDGEQTPVDDSALCGFLGLLDLDGLLARVKGGLDGVADWSQVLSGGERQRLSLTRLLFHRPLVAVLDESTSAVSEAMEAVVYEECARLQITLLSVSHRSSALRFHSYQIAIDFGGAYNISNLHRSPAASPSKGQGGGSGESSRRSSYSAPSSSPSSPGGRDSWR